jgi:hypothetical protein
METEHMGWNSFPMTVENKKSHSLPYARGKFCPGLK